MKQPNVFCAKHIVTGELHYLVANCCYRSGMYVVEIRDSNSLSKVASRFIGTFSDCEPFLYKHAPAARQSAQRGFGYSKISSAAAQLGTKFLPAFDNPTDGLGQAVDRPFNMACGSDFRRWFLNERGLRAEQEMIVVNSSGQRVNEYLRLNEIDEKFDEIDTVYGVAVFDYKPCPEVMVTVKAEDIVELDQHRFYAQDKREDNKKRVFKFPASHDAAAMRHLVMNLHHAVLKLDRVIDIKFCVGEITGLENYDYVQEQR